MALLAKKKKSPPTKKSRLESILGALLFMPFFALIMSCAGALFLAMVFSVFSLNLHSLQKATGMILHSIFVSSIFHAFDFLFPTGLAIGIVAGCLTLLIPTKHRGFWLLLAVSSGTSFGVTILTYCVFVGYSVFQSALLMSQWGCTIGVTAGGFAGIAVGIHFSRNTTHKHKLSPDISQGKRGAHPADLDWWQTEEADTGNDSDID